MKARKQGNSLTLSIPKKFGVEEGQEFMAFKGRRGGVVYVPVQEDIFEKALEEGRSLRYEESLEEIKPVGREMT
ncbi:hypothetical protein BKP56_00030 [Marinilactibacillus sp. 15R]|uniref:SpoVT-AbrB domain-containing protein n=1 Tax=Marinilactibacillus piezotolerans TaxID=258723 RepID=A0A1I3Y310_9LACT|nr:MULTISPECIES: hypothetical protein [Marinilactibacillus]API87827.1 hypothetical protein BKP56_00030 [Marinilactibacillus sp. 15R]SFK26244.1 hypothetical protein SAMN04488569_10192 [Marinilactibacillus piezotolerans]